MSCLTKGIYGAHILLARCYVSASISCRYVSVCVFVTRWYCFKMVKLRIMQTMPYDSPGIFLMPTISTKFDRGYPQWKHQMQMGLNKIGVVTQ